MRTYQRMSGPERGFTIVEIMVALVVTVLLLAGVMELFIGNRQTYRLQNGMANLQENARVAMDVLRHDLSMAGNPRARGVSPFDSARSLQGPGIDDSDSIAPRFETDTDCLGAALPAGTVRTHLYTVQKVGTKSSLYCSTDVDFATASPIVEGVEGMRVLYGVDTDTGTNQDYQANVYKSAGAMAAGDWTNVVSVRVGLLVNTTDPVTRADAPDTQTYYLLGAPGRVFNDQMRRNVYTFTVTLRNTYGDYFF